MGGWGGGGRTGGGDEGGEAGEVVGGRDLEDRRVLQALLRVCVCVLCVCECVSGEGVE